MQRTVHTPVLLAEVLRYLDPKPGEFVIDGTLGGGGYAQAIVERLAPGGAFLGFDWDVTAITRGNPEIKRGEERGVMVTLVSDNFARIPEFLARHGYGGANGLVLDLGFSSDQLERSGRGFSFERDEPLLMTYDHRSEPVRDILKRVSAEELEEILRMFGEERRARPIARAIKGEVARRGVTTSGALVRAILRAAPKHALRGRIHPATRTFLALRVYANHELDNLEFILSKLHEVLREGGRVCVVSFHSLEDRLVKYAFRALVKRGRGTLLVPAPVRPTREECARNPRARSAKLRALLLT